MPSDRVEPPFEEGLVINYAAPFYGLVRLIEEELRESPAGAYNTHISSSRRTRMRHQEETNG
jgi:hypothetical protein